MHKVLKSSWFEIITESVGRWSVGVLPCFHCGSLHHGGLSLNTNKRPSTCSSCQRCTKKYFLETEISLTISKSKLPVHTVVQRFTKTSAKQQENSLSSNKCLAVPWSNTLLGSLQVIETLPTIAPAISLSPRCGRAFSSHALINKGIAGWLRATILRPLSIHHACDSLPLCVN